MDGGERVARVLGAHGVPFLFTLVGGHISPILVAAKRQGIRVVDVRHEATAVFAADAVGRLTGAPGVAVVTAGPGVTNTLTAIKNASLAQAPLVLIGGATATLLRGRGSLQDIDQVAVMAPHVKWMARPNRLREVVPSLERALFEAAHGVPGPVFVELAIDLLYGRETVASWTAAQMERPGRRSFADRATRLYIRWHQRSVYARSDAPTFHAPRPEAARHAPARHLSRAARLVSSAARPLIVLGSQAVRDPRRAPELVRALERLGMPVWLSGGARGLLGASHPLLFRHARRASLKRADVVVLAGVPNDFRLDYGRHVAGARVIGIHLSATDLRKNRRPDVGMLAEPHDTLVALSLMVVQGTPHREGWLAEIRDRETARDVEISQLASVPGDGGINPLVLLRAIDAHVDADSVLVGDGGDFVATASYTVRPRGAGSWLDPGVFGTLGVGAGFALAAKLVRPDADVWLLWGDGAAGYSILELDTFVRHGLPIIAVVGNDAAWTQILRDQVPLLGDDVACRLASMDYHVVADGCGARGFDLSDASEVQRVLGEALETARSGTPALVNARLGSTSFRKGSISM